ncbi:MAG TPA: hypothetical protein VIK18_02605, partial [Pirellulales bacterium]
MNASRLLIPLLLVLLVGQPASALAATPELEGWIRYLDGLLPDKAADYRPEAIANVAKAADAVDEWSAYAAAQFDGTPASGLDVVRQLLSAKARVDLMLDRRLEQRAQFAVLDPAVQRDAIRSYLRVTSKLIDLSGRLRYLLADGLNAIAADTTDPSQRSQLLALLGEYRSSIGATAVAAWLTAPPPASPAEPSPP